MGGDSLRPMLGIVDSGGPSASMEGACRFELCDSAVIRTEPTSDRLGHDSQVEAVVRRALPDISLRHAQVFGARPVTTAAQVAAAIEWLNALGVRVICLSLGLAEDRAPLRYACLTAAAHGIHVVAAAPVQGRPSYPARYAGVIAATGDARCDFDEISVRHSANGLLFGAWCASPERTGKGAGGASIGCARIAAHVVRVITQDGASPVDPVAALATAATYRGREQRGQLA